MSTLITYEYLANYLHASSLGDIIGYKNGDWEFNGKKNSSYDEYKRQGYQYTNVIVFEFIHLGGINNLKYDNNNINAVKITSYFTMLNNVRTTQFDYNTGAGIQWLVQKDNLVGSALMSSNEYFYNFTHVEQLTGSKSYVSDPNLDEGLSLDTEIKFDIQAEAAADLRHYIFGITLRQLTLSPSGNTLF